MSAESLANLDVFAATLLELAQHDRNILVLTSDSRGSGKLTEFGRTLPAQLIEVGIAEQNLVGMAAGLAAGGKIVFAVSPACFLTARALEQIKNDVAYSNWNVKLVGISAGVSYGALGSTHHSLHDFAALQAIPNIDIIAPADAYETRQAIYAAVKHPKPLYLRFGKKPLPRLHPEGTAFAIGKAIPLRAGKHLTFLATGETTWRAVQAAELLSGQGIEAGVLSIHSLRPFDEAAVLAAAQNTGCIITVEEHHIHGGLGGRVAELLIQTKIPVRCKIIGIPDETTIPGSQEDILGYYGISPPGLVHTARQLLGFEENT